MRNAAVAALILCPLTAAAMAEPVRYDGVRLVRVQTATREAQTELERLGAEPWGCRFREGESLYSADPATLERLRKAGIETVVVHEDVQALIDAQRAGVRGGGFFDDYQRLEDIEAYMGTLADLRPDLVEQIVVGQTLEGRAIRGLKITGPTTGAKPGVLINGGQHAREWISPAATMYVADTLVRGYDDDAGVQALVDGAVFYVAPVVNADGYVYSWDVQRLWRKNRRFIEEDNTFGVDPNRNWAFAWGGAGSSGNPFSSAYRGEAPFSEPCTSTFRDWIESVPEIRAHLDVHNFAQLTLGAWAYTNTPAPEGETLLPLGQAVNDAMVAVHGTDYDFDTGDGGIGFAAGSMPDWTFGALEIVSWTIELRDEGQFGFLLPASQIVPTGEELYAGVERLTQQLLDCPMDLNLDGVVGSTDLALLINRWNSPRGVGDVDLSGAIGVADLGALIASWGDCGG